MPRHQLLQLPALFVLGIIWGSRFSKDKVIDLSWSIAIFIFIMSSFVFWMLPHSIDVAAINAWFNRVMHINMLVAGFLLVPALRHALFEIKIIFLGMWAAMITAAGIALRVFDILLCSAFTIEQQKETGLWLIIIGTGLYAFTLFVFFSGLSRK